MRMFSHEPEGYECPFCFIVQQCQQADSPRKREDIVFFDDAMTVLVPPHHYAAIRGNVLVFPNRHFENIFDIDCELGADLLRATQRIAFAMKHAYNCEGISTRQHNEPAGYQDVWHYHLHVFPRFTGDNLYAGSKARYEQEERFHHAQLLRSNLQAD